MRDIERRREYKRKGKNSGRNGWDSGPVAFSKTVSKGEGEEEGRGQHKLSKFIISKKI